MPTDRLAERRLVTCVFIDIAANGGPTPTHAALRGLGYDALSDLLSFRVG